ncbi:MAG: hypothetical protein LBV34_28645 [Nocardiopsaceae bacterium]|jgi:hypothetical protein|nr:hypothetical protein [Nocardiopsaceae bacterium]
MAFMTVMAIHVNSVIPELRENLAQREVDDATRNDLDALKGASQGQVAKLPG